MSNKNCDNCAHYAVCGVRPDPYMGSQSSGHLKPGAFDELKKLILEFYGKNCEEYLKDK